MTTETRTIEPGKLSVPEVYTLLVGGVNPRPIALVATMSENNTFNLAPYSFFNAFGANPPMVAFSPTYRVRDGTRKDTFHNLKRTEECTIQVVTFDMVEQVNLASTEYATGVDEFLKSGLTPIPSDLVTPPRVKESPFQMECRLERIVDLGDDKGSGNLMVCEVIRFHIRESVFTDDKIDPCKMDLVARNGGEYYTRAYSESIFTVRRPTREFGIGYDLLPEHMKQSRIYTGNDLAKFAGINQMPDQAEVDKFVAGFKQALDTEAGSDLDKDFEAAKEKQDHQKMLKVALLMEKQKHHGTADSLAKAAQAGLQAGDLHFSWMVALHAGR